MDTKREMLRLKNSTVQIDIEQLQKWCPSTIDTLKSCDESLSKRQNELNAVAEACERVKENFFTSKVLTALDKVSISPGKLTSGDIAALALFHRDGIIMSHQDEKEVVNGFNYNQLLIATGEAIFIACNGVTLLTRAYSQFGSHVDAINAYDPSLREEGLLVMEKIFNTSVNQFISSRLSELTHIQTVAQYANDIKNKKDNSTFLRLIMSAPELSHVFHELIGELVKHDLVVSNLQPSNEYDKQCLSIAKTVPNSINIL